MLKIRAIKVYFNELSVIPQQKLNEIAFELALGKADLFNEFNRTDWAIKGINLIDGWKRVGINVFAST